MTLRSKSLQNDRPIKGPRAYASEAEACGARGAASERPHDLFWADLTDK